MSSFMQNIRFAFFAEHNPVRHISDLASDGNKYHLEEEKDDDGNDNVLGEWSVPGDTWIVN